jgi:hypothetical protein
VKKTAAFLAIVATAACAKSTSEIPATYVSPVQYSDYSCKQIKNEMTTLSRRVSDLGGHVDKTASDDKIQTGVGIVLFWPALFFLDGNSPQAVEYGRLKGEFEALESAANQKNCGFKFEKPEKKVEKVEEKKPRDFSKPAKN